METSVQKQIIKLSTIKLKPYRKFIKKLLKIEEKGLVGEKDYRKLCALFKGRILPHYKNAHEIADNLMTIGRCVGMGNENARLHEELQTPVITIINILMRDMGLGGELNEAILEELESAEEEFFPQLFRQAVKEALDNVLVNYSDYCLLNRGEYVQEKDGEYIEFAFLNCYPHDCKIMVGPFTDMADAEIRFQLYVLPAVFTFQERNTYVVKPKPMFPDVGSLASNGFVTICTGDQTVPIDISRPLSDSALIQLEMEDYYNDYIPSFLFDAKDTLSCYRRNYTEVAFAIGQRVKYFYLNGRVVLELMHVYEFIDMIEKIRSSEMYPQIPWTLDGNGELVTIY